jgi:hypothetical protein
VRFVGGGESGIFVFFGVRWRVVLLRLLVLVMMDDTCYIREIRAMGTSIYLYDFAMFVATRRANCCCWFAGWCMHASMRDACLGTYMFHFIKADLEHANACSLRLAVCPLLRIGPVR